jgi:hypothetical protein
MRRSICVTLLAVLLGIAIPGTVHAATCTADDFAAAVDRSGEALRAFNTETLPKLQHKLKQLKEKNGWSDPGDEAKALARIRDKRTAELDSKAEALIVKIDTLGRPPGDELPDCSKLAELDATGLELLAVMKAKSAYTLAKLDTEIAGTQAPAESANPPKSAAPSSEAQVARAPPPAQEARPPAPNRKSDASEWAVETQPPVVTAPLPEDPNQGLDRPQDGYTIDEIHEITRGFFGTISTSLASVLEYAFSKSGRPDGYVLGTEGGGAFLAGVRYGSGTLYLRKGEAQKIYWHGPSIGTDFGAAGSRTMFLIYNLREPAQLYRGFTGVDGSAYFVGGVGITFLKGGKVLMAPIRSGLGFRLGANVGYIRFTPRATWNPF